MPSEISALEKHECPACGAQAEWNPTKQALVCPFCGTESPYVIDRETGKATELDLVKMLRELGDEDRGWQAERRSVQCQSCKAVMVYDVSRVGQNCEFCGSPALVDYSEIKSPIRPQSLLPFRIDTERVRNDIRRWWRSRWFAPGKLAASSLVDTVKSLYIPYWTFDARVECPWTAEAGHYYYVPVEGRDSKGRRVVRQERRVRWVPASGLVKHVFDDELIPGTHGIAPDLIRRVEPFPTSELVPYDTAFLSGHVVEHYQVVLFDAAARAEDQMNDALRRLCAAEIPGDTYRNLQISPRYSDRTFKHILVPVWLLTYNYGRKAFQVLVNGSTGRIAGKYPLSWPKIVLAALAALIVVLVVVIIGNR